MAFLDIAGLVLDGLDFIGDIFHNTDSSAQQRSAMAQNEYQFNKSLEFNREESQKARDFQREEWFRQWNIQANYNSPQEQLKRLAQVGLNGQSLYGDSGNAGQVFGTAGVSTPAPPSSPAPPYISMRTDTKGDMMKSFAELLSHSASAFKDTAEGNQIARTTKYIVNNAALDNIHKRMANESLLMDNLVKKDTALAKAWADIQNSITVSALNVARGVEADEHVLLMQAQEFTELCEQKLKGQELQQAQQLLPLLIIEAKERNRLLGEQVNTEKSKQADYYSSADEHSSRRALLDTQQAIAKVEQRIKEDPEYKKQFIAKMRADVDKVLSDKRLTDAERKRTIELKNMLEKENAWKNFNEIWSKVTDIADIGLDVFRTATFQNFFNSESSRKNARDQFEREHYGDVTETDNFSYYDSQGRRHNGSVSRKRAPKRR